MRLCASNRSRFDVDAGEPDFRELEPAGRVAAASEEVVACAVIGCDRPHDRAQCPSAGLHSNAAGQLLQSFTDRALRGSSDRGRRT